MRLTLTPPAGFGHYAEIFRITSLIPTNWSVALNRQAVTSGVETTWIDYASSNQVTGYFIISETDKDFDKDGFSDLREKYITHTIATNFNFKDDDGDTLHDWYETMYFGDLSKSGEGDEDADGLSNAQELVLHSNSVEVVADPTNSDTDGDGTDDGTEVLQGSDPADPSDAGEPPPATTPITLSIRSYDNSVYTLSLVSGAHSYSVDSSGYPMHTITVDMLAGYSYTLQVSQSGAGSSDTAGYEAELSGSGIIIDDDNHVLGDNIDESGWVPADLTNTGTVHVLNVALDSVSNADYIGAKNGQRIYATAKGTNDVVISLLVQPETFGVPYVFWTAGTAGNNHLERKVSTTTLNQSGQTIRALYAGKEVFNGKIFIYPSKPEQTQTNTTLTTSLTLDHSVALKDNWFGGFAQGDAANSNATYNYTVYYENKKWKAVLNSVSCAYRYNVQDCGKTDVPDPAANPFPVGAGLSSNSTQQALRQAAKIDFTPVQNTASWWVPPQVHYCSLELVDEHEHFHYTDWTQNYYPTMIHQIETAFEVIEKPVTLNSIDFSYEYNLIGIDLKQKHVAPAMDMQTRRYNNDCETKAFSNGKDGFQRLANET
jgi:hypothetical protein